MMLAWGFGGLSFSIGRVRDRSRYPVARLCSSSQESMSPRSTGPSVLRTAGDPTRPPRSPSCSGPEHGEGDYSGHLCVFLSWTGPRDFLPCHFLCRHLFSSWSRDRGITKDQHEARRREETLLPPATCLVLPAGLGRVTPSPSGTAVAGLPCSGREQ